MNDNYGNIHCIKLQIVGFSACSLMQGCTPELRTRFRKGSMGYDCFGTPCPGILRYLVGLKMGPYIFLLAIGNKSKRLLKIVFPVE